MTYMKTMVCLANSRKPPSGRCVAGREITNEGFGGWIRPVSARPSREISTEERRYQDGKDPNVLDIIGMQMTEPLPEHHQDENHLIDPSYRWEKVGSVSWTDLQAAVEDPAGPLWVNGYSSSHGQNDRVPEDVAAGLTRSLYLVRPERFTLFVGLEGGDFGPPRRRVRARFDLCGHRYLVAVTDPWMESRAFEGADGETRLQDPLLCMSLSEIFHGFAYKLAAAIITPERGGD